MSVAYAVWRNKQPPSRSARTWRPDARVFIPGVNLFTGSDDVIASFGPLSSLEKDLLLISGTIFAADRGTQRGEREDLCRTIDLHIPVYNPDRIIPLVGELGRLLRELSQDGWRIQLRQAEGHPDGVGEEEVIGVPKDATTLLFSGGLDSLAAAVEFGRRATPLHLVSHITKNQVTDRAQQELAALLNGEGFNVEHRQFFVSSRAGGPTGFDHDVEASQRTRSLVFLTLGAISARRTGHREIIYMAENGQLAIHLPLTRGRIGAFSTHTAHPSVLARAEAFLSRALGVPFIIRNPYVYRTKSEVVARVVRELPGAVPLSTSCWRNTRMGTGGATHCGACIPCYLRRIALETAGDDPTVYARDVWSEPVRQLPVDDDGRRNLMDLVAFICRFELMSNEELLSEFVELYSNSFDNRQVIEMYRRFAVEAKTVLTQYPQIAPLLA